MRARSSSARRPASSTRRARRSSARSPRSASRASPTCTSAGSIELDVEDPSQLPAMCETLLANPLIEDYEIVSGPAAIRPRREVRRRPLPRAPATRSTRCSPPARRRGRTCSGTPTATSQGVDAVVVPGGFSYGDYLRVGRDRPLLADDGVGRRRSPATGGPVLGICNGFQVLCEAGLLPGALLPEHLAALRLPPGRPRGGQRADTPFTRACAPGERLSIPVKHTTGPLLRAAPSARRAGGRRPGAPALRPGPEPQRLARATSPAWSTRPRQRASA